MGEATYLYLVRHGESELNVAGRFCGSSDCALTDAGRRQAEALAAWIRHLPLAGVYASPLRRALDTAAPIGAATGHQVRARPALAERHYGDWEGLRFEEIAARWPEDLRRFKEDPVGVVPPGGEACDRVARRFGRAVRALARVHDGGSAVLVAHQAALRIFLAPLLGISLQEHYRAPALALGNTAVSLVRYQGGRPEVLWVNRQGHLGPC